MHLLLIFILALILRLLYISTHRYAPLVGDSELYHQLAVRLIEEGRYLLIMGYSWGERCYFSFYPPGYPTFLSIIYSILGVEPHYIRIIQVILGSFCCLLLVKISNIVFGSKKVGYVAGYISAFHSASIFFVAHLLTENLYIPLLLLTLWCILQYNQNKSLFWLLLSSLFINLSILVRVQGLIFHIPLIINIFLTNRKNKWLPILFYILVGVIILTPWSIRNLLYHNKFFLAMHGGQTIWYYNHPFSEAYIKGGKTISSMVKKAEELKLNELEEEAFFYKDLYEFIKNNPKFYIVWYFKKLSWGIDSFWNAAPESKGGVCWIEYCITRGVKFPLSLPTLTLSWGNIALLAIIGIILAILTQKKIFILLSFLLIQLFILLFVTCGIGVRHRAFIEVLSIVFASYIFSFIRLGCRLKANC